MTDPTPERLAAHYASPACKLILPPRPQFRQFKVCDVAGRWRTVKWRIRTASDLRRRVQALRGVDVYYSTSLWLNPTKLVPSPRPGTWMVADRCLIGADLVFDFDAETPVTDAGLETVRLAAITIVDLMAAHREYRLQYAAFTGHKGFRLAYYDLELARGPAPYRIETVRARRKALIVALHTAWQQTGPALAARAVWPIFDEVITTDPMRIIRVLGSVHRATGCLSVPVTLHALRHAPLASFRRFPFEEPQGPESPVHGAMTTKQASPPRRPHFPSLYLPGDVPGPASPGAFFITNNVLGTKGGYVPLLLYQAGRRVHRELKRLQAAYRLGPAYVFETPTGTAVLFLKVVQRRRLLKILAASTANNQHATGRYKMSWLPMPTRFLERQMGPLTGHISLAHALHVRPYAPVPDAPVSGLSELKLIKATPKRMP